MNIPVRKFYHVIKIGIFLVIVVTILSCFERWRGGRRAARAQYLDTIEEEEYEKQILEDEARIIPGLGEGGVAAQLVGEAKRLGEESEKELAINVYLSDRIAYNRTLKDYRNPACQRVLYDAELPSASIILIFHNEPYSVVVRTIWSVVNSARRNQPWYSRANRVDRETGGSMVLGYPGQEPSSPFVYLKEIILVDDNSTLPELKGKLSYYIRTRLPPGLVRIVRLPDRQGLMRARMSGARAARGAALVFLDAHCEAGPDWLRPLLQRLKHKRDAVLTPLIDVVDQTTFRLDAAQHFQVGGFTFMGHFTWVDVPEREKKRRGSDIAPTWSPTMAGGLFAINRAYFWELGAYDEQMAGWGGENLEMSFRIWQCGGTLETIPCSRVGHVFRSFHPYGLPAHSDTHGINTARMAEVWMDDYAELFYLHRPDLRASPRVGYVTHRRVLRAKLRCRPFSWYLDTVYREKFVPVRDVLAYGRFKNLASGLCLDTMQRDSEASPLGVYPCHRQLQATQYLSLSTAGELRDEEKCAELQYSRRRPEREDEARRVLMVTCHGKQRGQKWRYLPGKRLRHVESGLCLAVARGAGGAGGEEAGAVGAACSGDSSQLWDIDYNEDNDFGAQKNTELTEQELRLQRLRGKRRRSRSLSGAGRRARGERGARGHHGAHGAHGAHRSRARRKDKFILKLVRSLPNASEEHLEADLYCRHRRLLPNDSFVRDLVTALNDRDIKVINNGRVFTRNKVIDLGKKHNRVKEVKILEKMELPAEPGAGAALTAQRQNPNSKYKSGERLQPYRPAAPATSVRLVATEGGTVTSPNTEKKIIIEDFVAVKPSGEATDTPKRAGERGRGRARAAATTRRTRGWEEPLREESRDSVEDAPMMAGDGKRARDGGGWDGGGGWQTARAPAPQRAARARAGSGAVETDPYVEFASTRAPARLVMRSNVTFKLGDEFFEWKGAADDVANLLGELSIPESGGAPGRTRGGGAETVLAGSGPLSREEIAANESQSCGSSESAGADLSAD